MFKRLSLVIVLLAGLTTLIASSDVRAKKAFDKKVLLISIDGFRPEFYLDAEKYDLPALQWLKNAGAYAASVEPVFPTVTYANHTTLLTGLLPEHHGILSNTVFTWEAGPTPAWYWEADKIKAPTLNEYVQKAGGITASMGWPVTLMAKDVDYLIPEIFSMDGYYEGGDFEVKVKYTDPELMAEVLNVTTLKRYDNEVEFDFWTAEASAHILKTKKPDFMTIHFVDVDHVAHGFGPNAPEVLEALKHTDDNLKIVFSSINLKDTCVILTGDHGFREVSQKISPNTLFVKNGWIKLDEKNKLQSWEVIAHASGAQAAIYVKNKALLPEVEALLRANEASGFVVIPKSTLQKLGAYPEADLAIEGAVGFTVSGSFAGSLVSSSGSVKGQHGFLPTHKELHTGLVTAGCGLGHGQEWETVHLTDIPATIADILDLKTAKLDGESLD